jgi:mono/diheme cytochrome c family protein
MRNSPQPGIFAVPALLLVCSLLLAAHAQTSDVERGKSYARRVCAECHEVEPGIPAPAHASAPDFSSIASAPGMTAMALNVWLTTSHPSMPNLIIPQRDKEGLAAYFAALRAARKQAEPDE